MSDLRLADRLHQVPGLAQVKGGHGVARPRGDLLADTPVNALAQQVGVSVVAGVLLDHVHEQLAQ